MARRLRQLTVRRTERITPHMVRVVAGGDDLADFAYQGYADSYVKILFPVPGVTYPVPWDFDAIRRDLPAEQWPVQRTYTVRGFDADALELTVDFVHHGDVGVAGPWAAAARPGDAMLLSGPGGAYAPDPLADWHLLAGDAAALPAIAAALERIPAGTPVHAVVAVDGPDDEQHLDCPGDLALTWVHGGSFADVVTSMTFPTGRVHAFVHGEVTQVKALRTHLFVERGLTREQLSVSGYWRRGDTEEAFREFKASTKDADAALVDAEQARAQGTPV